MQVNVHFIDTPTGPVGTRRQYIEAEMVEILRAYSAMPLLCPVVIEIQAPMPKQGVTSTGSIMYGYGLWRGIVATLGLPVYPVRPAIWKAVMMRGMGKDKKASVIRACQLWPRLSESLRGPRGGYYDGRADALLLACYGRQELRLSGRIIGIDPGLSGAVAIIDP